MKQELKNYFSQFIMVQFNCMYYELYQSIGHSDRKKICSETYIDHYKKVFEPAYKNIRFCYDIMNEDHTYNYHLFNEIIEHAPNIHLESNINKARKYLQENPRESFELKFEEDMDDSLFENFLDNYLPLALNIAMNSYNRTTIPKAFIYEALIYCAENNLFSKAKTLKDFFYESKAMHTGAFTKEQICGFIEQNLSKADWETNIADFIYNILALKIRFYDGRGGNAYYLGESEKFIKSFYDALTREEKELMVFHSCYFDLVEKNICQDPTIIEGAKKHLNNDRFEEIDALFLSKYYPNIFNEKLKTMMIKKQRDLIYSLGLFKIASFFSGVTKKMARYLRSETSEKRAYSMLNSIKERLYKQSNILEVLTQFADTKHDRVLALIIKDCPKQYLYLFISNKLVRGSYTWSNQAYSKRNNE